MHHEERQRQRLRIRLGLDKRVLHDFPAPVWVDAQDLVVREIRVGAEADRVVARLDIMGVDSRGFLRFSTLASDFPAKIHTKPVPCFKIPLATSLKAVNLTISTIGSRCTTVSVDLRSMSIAFLTS